jgi:hypothetical protein
MLQRTIEKIRVHFDRCRENAPAATLGTLNEVCDPGLRSLPLGVLDRDIRCRACHCRLQRPWEGQTRQVLVGLLIAEFQAEWLIILMKLGSIHESA